MQNVPTLYGPVTRSQYDKAAQIRLLVCDVDGCSPTASSTWETTAKS